jgi:uncharacterized protein YceK
MNKILVILMSLILIGCSSIQNPSISLGKKCVEKGDQVHYSYVWIFDGNAGLQADEITCELIDKDKEKK